MAAETAGRPRLIGGGGQGGLGTPILSLGPQTHLVIQSHIA